MLKTSEEKADDTIFLPKEDSPMLQNEEKTSNLTSDIPNKKETIDISEDTEPSSKIVPLDGGWGWLLVFSSAMLFLLVHGVTWCMGIFFNPLREYFHSSRTQTSWLNSTVSGIYDFIGVLVSPFVNRFGFRKAAMFGSLLAASAIFVSTFAPDMPTLIVTFGLFGGTGLGFMHIPAVVIVGHYFHKRRSFATGLVCSSGGIGAFIFAPMLNYFITEYGWKGTFWLLSGIILNGVVCAYLYKIVDLKTTSAKKLGEIELVVEKDSKGGNRLTRPLLEHSKETAESCQTQNGDMKTDACSEHETNSRNDRSKNETLHLNAEQHSNVGVHICNVKSKESTPEEKIGTHICKKNFKEHSRAENVGTHTCNDICSKDYAEMNTSQNNGDSAATHTTNSDSVGAKLLPSKNGSHALATDENSSMEQRPIQKLQTEESAFIEDGKGTKRVKHKRCGGLLHTVSQQLGLPLLKSPTFVTYTISVFLWSAGLFVPPTYLPPLAMDLGIDSTRAALLVSMIGMSNTVGRVIFGFISDLPRVDPLIIKTVMVVVGGSLTCLVPHLKTYPSLAAYSVLYGSCIGVYVTLRSPVLVDLVGLHNFTSAFGLLYMAHGFGGFVGSPLAIFLADTTGNYKLSFYVIGAIFIMAGLLCAPLRRIASWEHSKANKGT